MLTDSVHNNNKKLPYLSLNKINKYPMSNLYKGILYMSYKKWIILQIPTWTNP